MGKTNTMYLHIVRGVFWAFPEAGLDNSQIRKVSLEVKMKTGGKVSW